jgi:hypothetical protein
LQGNLCGYTWAGNCSAACSSSNTYAGCATSGGTAYNEVITVFDSP